MMKYIFLSCLIVMCSQAAPAQISATLVVNTTPTDRIGEWGNDNSIVNYIVNNQSQEPYRVIIKTEIRLSDGTLVATKDLARANIFTLAAGNNIYHANDVLPTNIMIFSGSYKDLFERTGKLPAGYYQLVVQLVSPQDYAPVTQPLAKNFYIPAVQLPVLMKPLNNSTLNYLEAQTAIIFRWTPKVPHTQDLPNYNIRVFEITGSQQPLQALRSNQPLLDITVKGQTQYIWRPQLSFTDNSDTARFIWTITTLDANNEPVLTTGNAESLSEPFVFQVAAKQ